jgi:hypothetical protein
VIEWRRQGDDNLEFFLQNFNLNTHILFKLCKFNIQINMYQLIILAFIPLQSLALSLQDAQAAANTLVSQLNVPCK